MTQDYIPFPAIIAELRKLCNKRATGTLFISTKKNRSAQVALDKGQIVFVYFYNKRGQEALDLMATITAGRFRFQEGSISPRRVSLPPTNEILNSLGDEEAKGDSGGESPTSQATVGGLKHEEKNVIENCLAEYIGPMAGIICDDHLGSVSDVNEAIAVLVTEIPSSEQAEKFKSKVLQLLN